VGEVLKRCLAKSPDDRWQSLRDVSALVGWLGKADEDERTKISKRSGLIPLAAGLALAAFAGMLVWLLRPESTREVVHLSLDLPSETFLGSGIRQERTVGGSRPSRTSMTLSPGGDVLVFSAVGTDDQAHLYSRRLDEPSAVRMEGTAGAVGPVFSPDGAWVAFWSAGELKKVALEGGLPVPLGKTEVTFGTSWGPDGRVAFANETGGLWQVSESGGKPEPLTTLAPERGEQSHRLPHFLPNGKALLFTTLRSLYDAAAADVVLLDLATGERRVLVQGGTDARYAESGHLLFARESVLMVMPFDTDRMKQEGAAAPAILRVMQAANATDSSIESKAAQWSLSTEGTLVYVEGGVHPTEEKDLIWLDRAGTEAPTELPPGPQYCPRLSNDGALIALDRDSAIWVYDVHRGSASRLTFGGVAEYPLWSPDDMRLVFLWHPGDSPPGIFVQAADGSGSPTRLSTGLHYPSSWSRDGSTIAFVADGDLWTLSLGDSRIESLAQTPFEEQYPAFSPDGTWLAYTSDESGRAEVYLRAFPSPAAKHQISNAGGHSPAWARSGRELFYLHYDGAERGGNDFMAVEMSSSPRFSASRPRRLFRRAVSSTYPVRNYDVAADGRFLILPPPNRPTEEVTKLHVVLNWFEELERLAPTEN
jgi:serine/threonine-protein kinase